MTNYTLTAAKGTFNYSGGSKIFPKGTQLYQSTTIAQAAFLRWSENYTNGIQKVYKRWNPGTYPNLGSTDVTGND